MNPTEAVSRFFSLHQRRFPASEPVLVACSGGPDSVALAAAVAAVAPQIPYTFHLAHVHHGLRGVDADRDADVVRRLAKRLGWRFHLRSWRKRLVRGNLEGAARNGRYEALSALSRRLGGHLVLTAHHQEDQAETVLMHLLRGAGPDGLAGMAPLRLWRDSGVWVGRPFLDVSRAAILKFLRSRRLLFRVDRSNTDELFLRNWIRRRVMPLLERRAPGCAGRIAKTAEVMRGEHSFWDDHLAGLFRSVVRFEKEDVVVDYVQIAGLPVAVRRRLLRRATGADLLTFDGIGRLLDWMSGAPTGGRFFQLRRGRVVERLSRSRGAPSSRLFCFRKARPGVTSKPLIQKAKHRHEKI